MKLIIRDAQEKEEFLVTDKLEKYDLSKVWDRAQLCYDVITTIEAHSIDLKEKTE